MFPFSSARVALDIIARDVGEAFIRTFGFSPREMRRNARLTERSRMSSRVDAVGDTSLSQHLACRLDQVGESIGRALAQWARGGSTVSPPEQSAKSAAPSPNTSPAATGAADYISRWDCIIQGVTNAVCAGRCRFERVGCRMNAPIRSMAGLVEALRQRRDELNLSHETIDAISSLQPDCAGKLRAPRNMSYNSLGRILGALGVGLQILKVVDRHQSKRVSVRKPPISVLRLAGRSRL